MRALVREGMEQGAFGLSSGLFYVPGAFTPTEEVIELARVAGSMGGIYISHMRDEAKGLEESVRETIAIGEKGGLPTQITHHKVVGKKYWGGSVRTLRMVDEARARGVDATIDQYPYTASATSIGAALLPAWANEGGRDATLKRLKDPATRAKIKAASVAIIRDERGGGDPKNVVRVGLPVRSEAGGTEPRGRSRRAAASPVSLENAAETAMWIVEQGGCGGIFHAIGEEDLQRILVHPATMIGVGWRGGRLRPQRAASAQLRHVCARARALRARQETPAARNRGAEDVGVSGAAAGYERSGCAAARD